MSGQNQDDQKPEVFISGSKIPYSHDWLYRVTVDGVLKDLINSRRRWTPTEIVDVQEAYTESLTGYVLGGEPLVGWTPQGPPEPRKRPGRRRVIRSGYHPNH